MPPHCLPPQRLSGAPFHLQEAWILADCDGGTNWWARVTRGRGNISLDTCSANAIFIGTYIPFFIVSRRRLFSNEGKVHYWHTGSLEHATAWVWILALSPPGRVLRLCLGCIHCRRSIIIAFSSYNPKEDSWSNPPKTFCNSACHIASTLWACGYYCFSWLLKYT